MQPLQIILFWAALALYLINRYILGFSGFPEYQVPYLNDLLCLPVVLTVALWLQQKLFPRTARARLNGNQVIFAVVYFAIFFEGILPAFSERYTRDYWDVVAYTAGGLVYYFFFNPKPPPLPSPK